MADEDFIYACVHAGMVGVLITPLFILWSVSLCLARRRKDPARTGITWLKIVYPVEILALILITAGDAIYAALIAYTNGYSRRYNRSYVSSMSNAQYRIGTVGVLFERVANVLLIITFVELGNGFMYILNYKRTAIQTTLRYVSFVAAVVLTALNVATTARFNVIYGQYLNSSRYTDYNRQIRDARKISGAYDVLNFIASIGLLVYASVIMHRFRNIMFTKNSAVVLLVAAVLNFIRWLYALVIAALFLLETSPTVSAPEYINIIDAVLNTWIFFVVLVLLFVIGVWKHKGLWSTAQPFMSGPAAAPPMVYAIPQQQYGYGAPQQMAYQPHGYLQPQGWQGQPVQQPQQAYTGHTSVSPVDQQGTLPPQQQQVPTPGPEGQANGFYPREMKA